MAEVAPAANGAGNRTFIYIVGGLAGLLVLGLLALGAILLVPGITGSTRGAALKVGTTTPTRVAIQPTAVQIAAVTATLVVSNSAKTPTVQAFVTATPQAGAQATTQTKGGVATTPAAGQTTTDDQLPKGGLGEDLLFLAVGLILVVVIFAARRARSAA